MKNWILGRAHRVLALCAVLLATMAWPASAFTATVPARVIVPPVRVATPVRAIPIVLPAVVAATTLRTQPAKAATDTPKVAQAIPAVSTTPTAPQGPLTEPWKLALAILGSGTTATLLTALLQRLPFVPTENTQLAQAIVAILGVGLSFLSAWLLNDMTRFDVATAMNVLGTSIPIILTAFGLYAVARGHGRRPVEVSLSLAGDYASNLKTIATMEALGYLPKPPNPAEASRAEWRQHLNH